MSGEGLEEAGPKPGLGPASKCLGLGDYLNFNLSLQLPRKGGCFGGPKKLMFAEDFMEPVA